MPRRHRHAMLGLSLLLTISCDSSSSSAPHARETRVLLTDAPFPYERLARADLYIVSVSVSMDADTGPNAEFVTVAEPRRRINVLSLQNGLAIELGRRELPPGAVTAVRMVIDTDSSSLSLRDGRVLTGSSTPGIRWQSSAGRPVLHAVLHEQIDIPDTGATIVIDYDLGRSFIPNQVLDPTSTDSSFVFSPVLRAADFDRTGTISGIVHAHSATGAVVADASMTLMLGNPANPPGTWTTLHTARTDSSGRFQFLIVTPTNWWQARLGTGQVYLLRADPPRTVVAGPALVSSVFVAAGADTRVGAVVLP